MYLVNMAVSDIIMCITAVPVTPYVAFTGKWIFGQYFCHFLPLCQVTDLTKNWMVQNLEEIDQANVSGGRVGS